MARTIANFVRDDMRALSSISEAADPSTLPPTPTSIDRPDFVWIDVEASSLHTDSYPVEIGWSFDDFSGGSFLIRPADDWDDWSWTAEQMHGASRRELVDRGLHPAEAVRRLNEILANRLVFSDTADGSRVNYPALTGRA